MPAAAATSKQHALPLPGGVGTFSICPAPVSVAPAAAAVVKAEPPLVLWGQPAAALQPAARGAFTTRLNLSPAPRACTCTSHTQQHLPRSHSHPAHSSRLVMAGTVSFSWS